MLIRPKNQINKHNTTRMAFLSMLMAFHDEKQKLPMIFFIIFYFCLHKWMDKHPLISKSYIKWKWEASNFLFKDLNNNRTPTGQMNHPYEIPLWWTRVPTFYILLYVHDEQNPIPLMIQVPCEVIHWQRKKTW